MGNCCGSANSENPPNDQKFDQEPKSPKDSKGGDAKVEGSRSRSRSNSSSSGTPQTPSSPESSPSVPGPEQVRSPRALSPSPNGAVVQLASGAMGGLTAEEQKQVAKALAEEMDRRKKWKALLRAKRCKKRKKPKSADDKSPSIEDALAGGIADPCPSPVDPETAAALEEAQSLELKRQEWIRSMQEQVESSEPNEAATKAKKKKKMKKNKKKREVEQQPESLSIDADQARELAAHTNVMDMMDKLMADAKQQSQRAMQKPEDTKKPAGPAAESAAPKQPADMSPDELIEFRRRDPNGWDTFTNANSVAAFALSKPTDEEKARALEIMKEKKGQKRRTLPFDKMVSVVSVPAGEDFRKSEKKQTTSTKLSLSPGPKKK